MAELNTSELLDREQADGPSSEPPALNILPTRPLVYAHRGAQGYVPENTLAAFKLAFDLGADGIECDVQRSHDGELVVIHDGTVDRTTDGTGLVSTLTLSQLRRLNAGIRAGAVERIPTMAETLALVRSRGGQLNLEIKGESVPEAVETARAVVAMLASLPPNERASILVSSFVLPALTEVKHLLPSLRVGVLYGTAWRRREMLAPAIDMGAEAIHPGKTRVRRRLVRRAHAVGLRVNVWTANRPARIAQLIDWGVDSIISDYPDRVVIERALATARR